MTGFQIMLKTVIFLRLQHFSKLEIISGQKLQITLIFPMGKVGKERGIGWYSGKKGDHTEGRFGFSAMLYCLVISVHEPAYVLVKCSIMIP